MANQGGDNINRRGAFAFAELEIEGTRECPRCHVPFNPHLGNLLAGKFKCKSCKSELSFRSSSGKAARCPCCNFFRPLPKSITILLCGGCEATVIYERGDEAVKCCFCKHINNSAEAEYGYIPPIQANPVVPPTQANQVVPPTGVNQVVHATQANQVVHATRVNQVVHPTRVNRRKLRANAEETESTATSSFVPMPESRPQTIVAECTDASDSVPQIVRNVALGIWTTKREDKTEAKSKKIRL